MALLTVFLAVMASSCVTVYGKPADAYQAAEEILAGIEVSSPTGPIPGMPTSLESAREALLAGNYTSRFHRLAMRDRCPPPCSTVGTNTSAWFTYGSRKRLDRACN